MSERAKDMYTAFFGSTAGMQSNKTYASLNAPNRNYITSDAAKYLTNSRSGSNSNIMPRSSYSPKSSVLYSSKPSASYSSKSSKGCSK